MLVQIAAQNASSISLMELYNLLPANIFSSLDSLREFIAADEWLSRHVRAVGDEVTLLGQESLAASRTVRIRLAQARQTEADRFLDGLARLCPWIEHAGVSGSTAYGAAKPEDDIDFFLVLGRRRLWVTLLVALVFARVARVRSRAVPVYCFNRLVERVSCERAFREQRDPLFAREVLSLRVLRGSQVYAALLRSASWMAQYFPGLYTSRLAAIERGGPDPPAPRLRAVDALNGAAFLALAPYLWLMGGVRNRRLKLAGRDKECFRTIVRPDFCATESTLFDELRDDYRKVFA